MEKFISNKPWQGALPISNKLKQSDFIHVMVANLVLS